MTRTQNNLISFCLFAALAVSAGYAAAQAKASKPSGQSGFLGHYGYLLKFPSSFTVKPEFQGAVELVQFIPGACSGIPQEQCLNAFYLRVAPKKSLFKTNKVTSGLEYVRSRVKKAKEAAEQPGRPHEVMVGKLKGWTLLRKAPQGDSLDAATYVEGSKVFYTFYYQSKNAYIGRVLQNLTEIQPHDNPPEH